MKPLYPSDENWIPEMPGFENYVSWKGLRHLFQAGSSEKLSVIILKTQLFMVDRMATQNVLLPVQQFRFRLL